jgi:peptidoglycan/LPS O-acetylase OafA/YrhL
MDTLPLHPKIVHLPIALAVLMPLITAGLLIAWWRDMLPRRTWWIAVALQALLVGSALYARETGEADEERVEDRVGEAPLEAHEEAATVFTVGALVALAAITAAALIKPPAIAMGAAGAAVLAALVVLGLGYRVGEAGGALVYRYGGASIGAPPGGGPATVAADDD